MLTRNRRYPLSISFIALGYRLGLLFDRLYVEYVHFFECINFHMHQEQQKVT